MRYYSPKTGTTYLDTLHVDIPSDVITLSDEVYSKVIANPEPGKIRSHDADGVPVLIDPPAYVLTDQDCRNAMAEERFKRETAGIEIFNMRIDTGRESQALITGAAMAAMLDSAYICKWKTHVGFVTLDATQILALASEVRAHVQDCFDREAELEAELEAGTFTLEMLSEGWSREPLPARAPS